MTILFTFLKLVSMVLAGLFGVLALLVDFKDKAGNITKWGRVALIGVIASATVSLSSQLVEHWQSELSARHAWLKAAEQLERSKKIVSHLVELERSIQPLEVPKVTVALTLPTNFSGGEQFVSKLRSLGKKIRDKKIDNTSRSTEYFINSSREGLPTSFRIDQRSSLFPSREGTPELYSLLAQTGVNFSFFSELSSLEEAKKNIEMDENRPSLGYFGLYGDYSFGIDDENIGIDYDIEKDEIDIWIKGGPESGYIRKNGLIKSVPDFEESYVLVSVDYTMVPSLSGGDYSGLQSNRRLLSPSLVVVQTSGREFFLKNLNVSSDKGGYRVFSIGPMENSK